MPGRFFLTLRRPRCILEHPRSHRTSSTFLGVVTAAGARSMNLDSTCNARKLPILQPCRQRYSLSWARRLPRLLTSRVEPPLDVGVCGKLIVRRFRHISITKQSADTLLIPAACLASLFRRYKLRID